MLPLVSRRGAVVLLAVTLSLAWPAGAGADSPNLDLDFGERGVSRAPFRVAPLEAVSRTGLVAARQRDGRLLVAGQIYGDERGFPAAVAVARFHRDGRLDRSFGRRGRLRLYFPGRPHFTGRPATVFAGSSLTVQRNGRIVLAGTLSPTAPFGLTPTRFGLVRLLRDGSLDRGFGRGGFSTWVPRPLTDQPHLARAELGIVVPQPDGRLLAAGAEEVWMTAGTRRRLVITRFRRDGSVDYSFGESGEVSVDRDLALARWAARPDGTFLAAGARGVGPGPIYERIAVVRFTRAGSLDRRFGLGGTAHVEGDGFEMQHLHIDRRRRVLITGGRDVSGIEGATIRLTRLDARGVPDASFGRGCRHPIPRGLAGIASAALGDGLLVATWKGVLRRGGRGYRVDSRVLRFTRRGCWDREAPRIALRGLAVGAPLRTGRRAAVIPAAYERGLALIRVRR